MPVRAKLAQVADSAAAIAAAAGERPVVPLLLISAHPVVISEPLIRLAGQVEVREDAVDVWRHDLARRANIGLVELVIAGDTE